MTPWYVSLLLGVLAVLVLSFALIGVWTVLGWILPAEFAGSPEGCSPGLSVEDRETGAPVDAHTPGASTGGTPTRVRAEQLQRGDYLTFYCAVVTAPPLPSGSAVAGVSVNLRTDTDQQVAAWFRLGEWVEVEREEYVPQRIPDDAYAEHKRGERP